jgi:competence protein ComEA
MPKQLPPKIIPTTVHRGGRIVKRIVPLILGVLLLSPGIVKAAERMAAQETPAVTATVEFPKKLDLNRASREDLVGVPGIGPSVAQAIVDLRSKKGSFTRLEELLEVTGIKEKKLASIAGYLEVQPPQSSAAATPEPPSR